MRNARLYFQDIDEACKSILEFVGDQTWVEFALDKKTKAAVVRQLEIIGEASRQLPIEIRGRYPRIPWAKIIGMRNVLIHGYFGVDERAVWDTVCEDVVGLKLQIQEILERWEAS